MNKSNVIAIDGPSGSGKSTIAKKLAQQLNLTYLDTGALYRAIAFTLDDLNISAEDDTNSIQDVLGKLKFQYGQSESELIVINDVNLSQKIREHNISELASIYSKLPVVRDFLKSFQRDFAKTNPSVLEGRDIGTVIFPDAELKIFLTADPEVRAGRRFKQLQEMGQTNIDVEAILNDIKTRDEADRSRKVAPLIKADDAIEIDTSSDSIDEVIVQIKNLYRKL